MKDAVDKDEQIITNAAGDEVFETTADAVRRREKSNERRIRNEDWLQPNFQLKNAVRQKNKWMS